MKKYFYIIKTDEGLENICYFDFKKDRNEAVEGLLIAEMEIAVEEKRKTIPCIVQGELTDKITEVKVQKKGEIIWKIEKIEQEKNNNNNIIDLAAYK